MKYKLLLALFCIISLVVIGYATNKPQNGIDFQLQNNVTPTILAHTVNQLGYPCDEGVRVFHMGTDDENESYWSLACKDGNEYCVRLFNNKAQAVPCVFMEMLGTPCFQKYE